MLVKYLVVHTAADPRNDGKATTTVEEIRNWHKARGWNDIGYHYVVLQNGVVQTGRPEKRSGAHTLGLNNQSLGICLSGHGDLQPLTEEQKNALVQLLVKLARKYHLKSFNVIGHREVNLLVNRGLLAPIYRTSKTCPGMKVSMAHIRTLVAQELVKINKSHGKS